MNTNASATPMFRGITPRFAGDLDNKVSSKHDHKTPDLPHDDRNDTTHSTVVSGEKKLGLMGRLSLGMENLGSLYSAGRLNTIAGKAMLVADVTFFMMSFVPLMHFMFLLQPSVLVFMLGAVLKKPFGHVPKP